MTNTYETLASIAQSVGLLVFMTGFLMITAYALWPSNRKTFDRAAHAPLDQE